MSFDFSFKLLSKNLVDLGNEDLHLRDEFDESFRHQDDSVLLSSVCSLADDICHFHGDIKQSLLVVLYFFTN